MKEILHPTPEDPSWITEYPVVLERPEFDVSMVLSGGLWAHLNNLTQQGGIAASTQSFSILLFMQNKQLWRHTLYWSKTSGEISHLIIWYLLHNSFLWSSFITWQYCVPGYAGRLCFLGFLFCFFIMFRLYIALKTGLFPQYYLSLESEK